MDTELKPQIHAYITYKLVESVDGAAYSEHAELVGWDTVNADQLSAYQQQYMGVDGYTTFMWEFGHPAQTLYYWDRNKGWVNMDKAWIPRVVPKELRMSVLCGAA